MQRYNIAEKASLEGKGNITVHGVVFALDEGVRFARLFKNFTSSNGYKMGSSKATNLKPQLVVNRPNRCCNID